MSLCNYLHDPEHIAAAIREGICSANSLTIDSYTLFSHVETYGEYKNLLKFFSDGF